MPILDWTRFVSYVGYKIKSHLHFGVFSVSYVSRLLHLMRNEVHTVFGSFNEYRVVDQLNLQNLHLHLPTSLKVQNKRFYDRHCTCK